MSTSARKTLAFTAPLLFALMALKLPAQAPEPKRDPRIDSVLNDLGKVRSIYQTAISPDGKMLAWVVAGEDHGKAGGTEIELAPLAAPEKPTRITAGVKGELCQEGSIAWSPDSKTLAFLSDCGNKDQSDFYLADGRRPNPRLSASPISTESPKRPPSRPTASSSPSSTSREPPAAPVPSPPRNRPPESSAKRASKSNASPKPTLPADKSARSAPPASTSTNSIGRPTPTNSPTSPHPRPVKTTGGLRNSTPNT